MSPQGLGYLPEWLISNREILGEDVLVITTSTTGGEVHAGEAPACDPPNLLGLDSAYRLMALGLKRGTTDRDSHLQAIIHAAFVSAKGNSECTGSGATARLVGSGFTGSQSPEQRSR